MELYINDRNGNRYTIKPLTFKKNLELQAKLGEMQNATTIEQTQLSLDLFKEIFLYSNKDFVVDNFDDLIEYNYECLGLEKLFALISMVIEKVFQSKGTNAEMYSFLPTKEEQ